MNLRTLVVPGRAKEMMKLYESYYDSFSIEMMRINSASFAEFVTEYFAVLTELSKRIGTNDVIRAAIGVAAMDEFGYDNFERISKILDRLVPQVDAEYVDFTCWCIGRILEHPGPEKSKYVTRLISRILGWTQGPRIRARHLAAAKLIESLSVAAGSSLIDVSGTVQHTIWNLLSWSSLRVQKATAKAISAYMKSITRYGRSELDEYVEYLAGLCAKLMDGHDLMRQFAALSLFQVLIKRRPNYFVSICGEFFNKVGESTKNAPLLVAGRAYVVRSRLAKVDKKLFGEVLLEKHLVMTKHVLLEFPVEITRALTGMIKAIPDAMKLHLAELCSYASELIGEETDCAFQLLSMLFKSFGRAVVPDTECMQRLFATGTMSEAFCACAVDMITYGEAKCETTLDVLGKRLLKELREGEKVLALRLLAKWPLNVIAFHAEFYTAVDALTGDSSAAIRAKVPRAMFRLGQGAENVPDEVTHKKLLQLAVFEPSASVKCAILETVYENPSMVLAGPDFIKILSVIVNDEVVKVRCLVFRILAIVSTYNPFGVMTINRHCILDSLFALRHIPSARTKSRTMRCLPDMIKTAGVLIQAYSAEIMSVLMKVLGSYDPKAKHRHFREEDTHASIAISTMESMMVLASLDSDEVANHGSEIVEAVCAIVLATSHRLVAQCVFRLLIALLSPPGGNICYRRKTPVILSTCSQFLGKTRSRRARIIILKLLGAIGCVETHLKHAAKVMQSPKNVDDKVVRQFFNPKRDEDNGDDESRLRMDTTAEQYFYTVSAVVLLDIFKDENHRDLYEGVAGALVQVLRAPRMYMLAFFDEFVGRLLHIMETSSNAEMGAFLPHLTELVKDSTHTASPFLKQTLRLVNDRFCQELMHPCLDIVLAFLTAVRDEFVVNGAETVCMLMAVLDGKKATDEETCRKVLAVFEGVSVFTRDMLYIIVRQICDCIMTQHSLTAVRICALNTIAKIALETDLYPYLCAIVQAINCAVFSPDERTKASGFELLCTLLKSQGLAFLSNAGSFIESLKRNDLRTSELKRLVLEVSAGRWSNGFKPLGKKCSPVVPKNPVIHYLFAEDSIISQIQASKMSLGRHLKESFRAFVLSLISNSPMPPIRACIGLAALYYPLAQSILNAAFVSCWRALSQAGKDEMVKFFHDLLDANDDYVAVAFDVLNVLFFMDRAGEPLAIPPGDLVAAAIRYGRHSYALHILNDIHVSDPDTDGKNVGTLIEVLIELGDWPSAVSVWNRTESKTNFSESQRLEIMNKLRLWEQIEPICERQFREKRNFTAFASLVGACASLGKWKRVMEHFDHFKTLETDHRCNVAAYFAEAAMHLHQWENLDEALQYAPDDSPRCGVLSALTALHNGRYDDVDNLLQEAFSVLASRPLNIWSNQNRRIDKDTMLICQELVEVGEMVEWSRGQYRKEIEMTGAWRLITAPRDLGTWFNVIVNRVRVMDVTSLYLVDFFRLKNAIFGLKPNAHAFDALFPEIDPTSPTTPDVYKICYAVSQWNFGRREDAIERMVKVSESADGDILYVAHLLSATWLMEHDNGLESVKKAYAHLKNISATVTPETVYRYGKYERQRGAFLEYGELAIPSQQYKEMMMATYKLDVLRKWADVNLALIHLDEDNHTDYVITCITSLARSIAMWPSFPDVVQLLNLFFENAVNEKVFSETSGCIPEIKSKLLVQAAPQIFVHIGDAQENLKLFVDNLVLDMLVEHYHDIVFSLIVLRCSRNPSRAKGARDIFSRLRQVNPEMCREVTLIRTTLLRAAVTWNETIAQRVCCAVDDYRRGDMTHMISTLRRVLELVHNPKCEMHDNFIERHGSAMTALENLLDRPNPYDRLYRWCKEIYELITTEIKRIQTIQLRSVSPELSKKDSFVLAVPATYRPGRPVVRIKYFVGQFSVYATKQQPKDVIVKGDDGNFYQYLLKGHEDLRLDERIMQFFRLINSFMMKDTSFKSGVIQTFSVILLSMSHGLVQWATGTDTMRGVIERYRWNQGRTVMHEYALINQYGPKSFDVLRPVQKLQIFTRICNEVPDTDIANFFWMKARTAELWWKRTTGFSTSTAIMSMVGYVVGLGDRHPSNILLNRFTGKIVHIDFGDCFDRARLRRLLPEVVPFRMTRMMVRALGPGGVDGLFRATFVNTVRLLRVHRRVLEMVLAIFVHEPLIDPRTTYNEPADGDLGDDSIDTLVEWDLSGSYTDDTSISSEEMRSRVNQKLTGTDIPGRDAVTADEQAAWLIESATNDYHLSKMYSGWCSFW